MNLRCVPSPCRWGLWPRKNLVRAPIRAIARKNGAGGELETTTMVSRAACTSKKFAWFSRKAAAGIHQLCHSPESEAGFKCAAHASSSVKRFSKPLPGDGGVCRCTRA